MGEIAPDNTRILLETQKILRKDINDLQEKLTKPMEKFREDIHDSEKIITKELVEDLYSHDAFTCVFFQPE